MKATFLLTGSPGSGKTTLIRNVISRLSMPAGGFYTQEIRQTGVRKGFEIVTLDGQRGLLAHVDIHSRHRIGKYGVDVEALEGLALPAIMNAAVQGWLVVIDEIGPMEILSAQFRRAVLDILDGRAPVLGSIVQRSMPFTDHDLPTSLYRSGAPEWWCQETPWPPIGPDVAGYTNDIPAKRRFEGLPCTQTTELSLHGTPADGTIYLSWEVTGLLPVTSTWQISYDGPPGVPPSPVSGLPEPTRAYTLSGLTNYALYMVTLNAMLQGSPVLTDTVTVMPTDLQVFMPVIGRE